MASGLARTLERTQRPPRPHPTFTTAFYDYPDYPRDSEGFIPEPFSKDFLTLVAEWNTPPIIDMNGFCSDVEGLTGVENEPLDAEFDAWSELPEFGNAIPNPTWRSEEDRQAFDDLGLELALKLYEHLHGASTIRYFNSRYERLILEARVKRIFPLPAQAGPEG